MPIKSKKVVEVIVEKPVVEECIIPPSVFTPDDSELLEACENGDLDTVYSKLWNQANVNCRKPLYGSSPLGVACRQGNGKVVNVLLEFGARPTMHDEYGVTPMHWAANSGNSSIIHTLMNKGKLKSVDLGKKDLYGSTPLHFASIKNLSDSVYTLIAVGSDPTIANNDGRRPSELTTNDSIKNYLKGNLKNLNYKDQEEKMTKAVAAAKAAKKAGKRRMTSPTRKKGKDADAEVLKSKSASFDSVGNLPKTAGGKKPSTTTIKKNSLSSGAKPSTKSGAKKSIKSEKGFVAAVKA